MRSEAPDFTCCDFSPFLGARQVWGRVEAPSTTRRGRTVVRCAAVSSLCNPLALRSNPRSCGWKRFQWPMTKSRARARWSCRGPQCTQLGALRSSLTTERPLNTCLKYRRLFDQANGNPLAWHHVSRLGQRRRVGDDLCGGKVPGEQTIIKDAYHNLDLVLVENGLVRRSHCCYGA